MVIYILLFIVLMGGLFARVYRTEDLLRFYYDQGRDALVIWRLWNEGKLFLIGPVTGLAGIFLGPLYYYMIAPFYLIGGGSPVLPALFLGFTATLATFMLYYLGWKFHSRTTGIFAALVGSFSYYIVLAGRWLANPTPLLLTSTLLLWSMWKVATGKDQRWWVAVALFVGASLQFESASAVFYLPMIGVFFVWLSILRLFGEREVTLPDKKTFIIASAVFLATLLPQILFNFRHENLLVNNFKRVLVDEKSFKLPLKADTKYRLEYFWSVYHAKIFPGWKVYAAVFSLLSATVIVANWKSLFKNYALSLLLIFIGIPILGYLTFYGNFGNIYDYYMTGYYLPMILLFSLGLGELWKTKFGKLGVIVFFILFFTESGVLLKNYLTATVQNRPIALEDQLQAVGWVFEDAKGSGEFNVDVYVPPVIPYAYDYLFLWRGTNRCGEDLCGMKQDEQVALLYTLYEADPPHPERLDAWLARQTGIGEIEEEVSFGGITVQRRRRI